MCVQQPCITITNVNTKQGIKGHKIDIKCTGVAQ